MALAAFHLSGGIGVDDDALDDERRSIKEVKSDDGSGWTRSTVEYSYGATQMLST
jgi:hypothetical protein